MRWVVRMGASTCKDIGRPDRAELLHGGVAEGKGAGHARWENYAVRVPPRKERGEAPVCTWRPMRLLPCGARAGARQLRPRLYRRETGVDSIGGIQGDQEYIP